MEDKKKKFIIYPAIDLLRGNCVRLRQGDYDKVTIYSDNPRELALQFKKAGATHLHVVDLDAARSGVPANTKSIEKIVEATGLYVQLGGGIRDMTSLKKIFDIGVSKAILGTAAVKNKSFTYEAIQKYGEKIIIALDSKNDEVRIEGWGDGTGLKTTDFAMELEKIGVKTVIYTDISRDGMLAGAELTGLKKLINGTEMDIIASGGISNFNDILDTKKIGAQGVIVGKAIYEKRVDLRECLLSV